LREAKRSGKVINISSCHEELPFPNFAPYYASKGGVRMLTRTPAIELGPVGIIVNGIAPGAIETPINAELLPDPTTLKPLLKNIPLGRIGQAHEVAGLGAFLASRDAGYVTGSTYFSDGSLTWHYTEQ
jgi:glucose 1-dehydrogenase